MAEPAQSDRKAVQVQPAEVPSLKTLLSLAIFVVIVAGLFFAREVLIPVTMSILLSFILAPIVKLMRWTRMGKTPAVLAAVLVALSLALTVAFVIGSQVAQLAQDAPRYESAIKQKVDVVRSSMVKALAAVSNSIAVKDRGGQPPTAAGVEAGPKPIPVEVHQPELSPFVIAASILEPILNPLATLSIVFIVTVFILLQRDDLRNRLIRLFGSRDLHRTTVALNEAAERLSKYFLSQLAVNASFGMVIGTGLFFLGVPSPVLWGIIAALLRFVPFVGAFLAAVPPLALAAGVVPGWALLIWTAALFCGVEFIVGQVVEPLLYGHSTGLAPISVVVAAIFWTWLWGPIGLILSTPLTVCLVVLGRHVERLEFIDVMLGDRPPLTDIEIFYQRMLAGEPEEALDQAEMALKTWSLAQYYDEVVLPGLRMASNDVLRGVLPPHGMDDLQTNIDQLLEELAKHDDKLPSGGKTDGQLDAAHPIPVARSGETAPEWQAEGAVACIAGRGPLDQAAATMLAQLVNKHGLASRVVDYEAVSRVGINSLNLSGVRMICVSYLEIDGSPSHLRFLLRRIHERAPDVPVLIGFWAADDRITTDERLQKTLGADHYTTTLRNALLTCLELANVPGAKADLLTNSPVPQAASAPIRAA